MQANSAAFYNKIDLYALVKMPDLPINEFNINNSVYMQNGNFN
jgi:hypothetical protein